VVRLTGHILCRNCLLKHVIEGKMEVAGRKRLGQLLDDLKEMGVYWKLNEEALDCTLWRTHFGKQYRPVIIQTTE